MTKKVLISSISAGMYFNQTNTITNTNTSATCQWLIVSTRTIQSLASMQAARQTRAPPRAPPSIKLHQRSSPRAPPYSLNKLITRWSRWRSSSLKANTKSINIFYIKEFFISEKMSNLASVVFLSNDLSWKVNMIRKWCLGGNNNLSAHQANGLPIDRRAPAPCYKFYKYKWKCKNTNLSLHQWLTDFLSIR